MNTSRAGSSLAAARRILETLSRRARLDVGPASAVLEALTHEMPAAGPHKFDLSFVAAAAGGVDFRTLRLSYHDHGEAQSFAGKVAAALACGGIDAGPIERALTLREPDGRTPQRSLAVQFLRGRAQPRLSVYFRNLQFGYHPDARRALLAALSPLAGPDAGAWRVETTDMVSLDAFPDGTTGVKAYELPGPTAPAPTGARRAFLAALQSVTTAFYYDVRGWTGGRERRKKLYKIYDWRSTRDYRPAVDEARGLLRGAGLSDDAELVGSLAALCAEENAELCPESLALESGSGGEAAYYVYLAARQAP